MAKISAARQRARLIPEMGRVKGGAMDGWRYLLLHLQAGRGELLVYARVTPPAWPFPKDCYLDHRHFNQLRAVPGDRARRFDQTELVRRAFAAERLEPPAFAVDQKNTLRAVVKRCCTSVGGRHVQAYS